MAYTTVANVRAVVRKVTAAVMTDAEITAFIVKGDAVVNSKIASRYSLPLASTPPLLETISTDIAAYYIMRTLFTRDGQNRNEWIDDYRASMKLLDEIRNGDTVLVDTTGAEVGTKSGGLYSTTSDYTPAFDMDDPENQQVDHDLIESIADERA
jgi:phage gp36-like protein